MMALDSTGSLLHLKDIAVHPEREDKAVWFLWDIPVVSRDTAEDSKQEGEEKTPRPINVERQVGKTHLLECLTGSFEFSINLPAVKLCKQELETLCSQDGTIRLTAFLGEDGDPNSDEKIGEAEVGWYHLVATTQRMNSVTVDFDCSVWESRRREEVASENEEGGSTQADKKDLQPVSLQLQLCFEKAPALHNFTSGSTVLEIVCPALTAIPEFVTTTSVTILTAGADGEKTTNFIIPANGCDASGQQKQHVLLFQEDVSAMAVSKSVQVLLNLLREEKPNLVGSKELGIDGFWSEPGTTQTVLEFNVSLVEAEDEAAAEGKEDNIETKEDEEVIELRLGINICPAIIPTKLAPPPTIPRPWEVIERRPGVPRSPPTAKARFREAVSEVAEIVLEEYFIIKEEHKRSVRQKYSPTANTVQGKLLQSPEGRSVLLLQRLNISEKYRQIHDILLKSIRGLVKDNPGLYGDERVENCRLEHMYGPVMKLVHQHLNDLSVATQYPEEKESQAMNVKREKDRLRFLHAKAVDLWAQESPDAADRLHQERVGISERLALISMEDVGHVDPESWTQYGDFCTQRGYSYHKAAAECYRSAIAIDESYYAALIGYAALLLEADNVAEALIFVVAAERLELRNPGCAMIATGLRNVLEEATEGSVDKVAVLEDAAYYCLRLRLAKCAGMLMGRRTRIIARMEFDRDRIQHRQITHLLLGWHAFVSGEFTVGEKELTNALDLNRSCLTSNILMGHIILALGKDYSGALSALEYYEQAMRIFTQDATPWRLELSELDTIKWMMRLGAGHTAKGHFAAAKPVYLSWCNFFPSAMSWRLVGKCCIELKELDDAFHALSEANIFDRLDPVVWGLLTLACLLTERFDLAETCFAQALKNKLEDVELLRLLIGKFVDVGRKQFLLKCENLNSFAQEEVP